MKQTEIMVHYLKEFVFAMFAYAVITVASNSLLMNIPSRNFVQFLVAIAPAVPVLFVLRAILRVLMTSDELQQRIQLYSFSFAAGAAGLITFSYGFLEGIGYSHMDPILVLPMMVLFWGLGVALFSRKYR